IYTLSLHDALPIYDFKRHAARTMAESEIEMVRALLSAKPRPVGWAERRQRLDEVGSVRPVASDVTLEATDLDGVPGEWSIVPGGRRVAGSVVLPWRRLLLRFDREPSPHGQRSGPGRGRAHAGDRLSPGARASVSGGFR